DHRSQALARWAASCDRLCDRMDSSQPLSTQACAVAPSLYSARGLEAALADVVSRARAASSGVSLDDAVFVRHVARLVEASADPTQALPSLHAGDLYLACACAHGDPAAIAHFDRQFLSDVREALARMDKSAAFIKDVAQIVRQKLLVSDGAAAPKIADY